MRKLLFGVITVALLVVGVAAFFALRNTQDASATMQPPNTFAEDVRAALGGVAITLSDRPDVSLFLEASSQGTIGWQATYTNPIDAGDTVSLTIANDAPVVDFGTEAGVRWFMIPFSVRTAGTGTFLYLGLFSRSGDQTPVRYRDAVLVGDRSVITSVVADGPGQASALYLTHAEGEPMALPPTTPAFVRVAHMDGSFVETLRGINTATSTVAFSAPQAGAETTAPMHVSGSALGEWFFEAQMPVRVTDPSGVVLGEGVAHAQGDWMTNRPVAFTADIPLTMPYQGPAILTVERDNPSGLAKNFASVSVPIIIIQ